MSLKALFDNDAEFMDRIFYRFMVFNAISIKVRDNIRQGMPDYLLDICGIYCKDCTTVMALNRFLDKWKIYINNEEHFLTYKEYIIGKISETINQIKERYDSFDDTSFKHLCGCTNFDRGIEEDILWRNHMQSYKHGVITSSSHEEYKNIFEGSLAWRNDLNKHLNKLNSHLDYFKRVPHKVYRDNILVPLTFATNSDCVNTIIGFL